MAEDNPAPQRHDSPPPRSGGRFRLWLAVLVGLAALAILLYAAWYSRRPQFQAWVRAQAIARLEAATGGRVELGELHCKLFKLEFEARKLTVHGREAPDQAPYIFVQRVYLRARILSLLEHKFGVYSIVVEQPAIHLIVYPDGSTNQPEPPSRGNSSAVQTLFDLSARRAEVHDGTLLLTSSQPGPQAGAPSRSGWSRLVPFEFSGDDLAALLSYDTRKARYDGQLHLGKLDVKLRDLRPFSVSAEAQLSLWRNLLTFRSLKLNSGRSTLRASGDLRDFNQPQLFAQYNASLDVEQVAATARVPQVRGGTVEVSGSGTWTAEDFSSTGKLDGRNLGYDQGVLHLRDGGLGANFGITNRKFTVTNIVARLFGGTATGSAEVTDWMHVLPASALVERRPGEARIGAPVQRGSIKLKVADLRMSALASALSSRDLPLDRLRWGATTSGTVDAHWVRSPVDAVVDIVADVKPVANPARGELPLTGSTQGSFRAAAKVFDIDHLTLATNATKLTASGQLGAVTASLNVTAESSNLGELGPLIAVVAKGGVPVEVAGQASFTGQVNGKLAGPTISGAVQLTNFDYLYEPKTVWAGSPTRPRDGTGRRPGPHEPVPHAQASSKRIHWDTASATIVYSPTQITARDGVLKHGAATVKFDLDSQLTKGSITDNSRFALRADVAAADVRELQQLAGTDYPVTGTLRCSVKASGTPENPQGNGSLQLTNATIHGEPFQRIVSEVRFADHEAQLTNIDATHRMAHITGAAAYNLTVRTFRFDLRGGTFNLANLQQLQTSRTQVSGALDFRASGSGTEEAPVINFDLNLRNLVLNGERMDDLVATGVTRGADLKFSAHSTPPDSKLVVDGDVHLRGDFPAKLQLRMSRLDVDPLLRAFLKGHLTGHSQVVGQAEISGPLKRPRDLSVQGELAQFRAELENLHVENRGPIRIALAAETVRLEQLHLVAQDTDLAASGTVELSGRRTLNLRANGGVNLKLVQTLYPDYQSSGTLAMDLRLGGTVDKPLLLGEATVSDGALAYTDLPNGLSDINGSLAFNQDRMVVQKMTAKTGGGSLQLSGFMVLGARGLSLNLEAHTDEMRLRYPQGISSMANADLRLLGTSQAAVLSGQVVITRFGLTPQFDLANFLARSKQNVEVVNPNSAANQVRLDLHVVSTPELQVQTSLAKLSGDVDLRIRGTLVKPVVLGRVNIIEGQVVFQGTKYQLERGEITFVNPTRIEPVVDIDASTRVRDYDITLGFHGPSDKLSTNYRSDPPLATADIIALLAFGRTREEAALQSSANNTFTESASNAILGQALNTAVSSRVQRLFGVSRLKIDPQVGGAENNAGAARVTIEQQVSNNLTITYITDVTRGNSNQQVIQAEYNVSKNVSLVAVRDQYGVVGFDVRIRQRRR